MPIALKWLKTTVFCWFSPYSNVRTSNIVNRQYRQRPRLAVLGVDRGKQCQPSYWTATYVDLCRIRTFETDLPAATLTGRFRRITTVLKQKHLSHLKRTWNYDICRFMLYSNVRVRYTANTPLIGDLKGWYVL